MKKLLVIVDMQNDFISGSLPADGGQTALQSTLSLINAERARGAEVVYTKDLHNQDYLSTQEGKRLPVLHCVRGTRGAEFADGIDSDGARIFEKGIFASVALGEYARDGRFDEILLAGVCTDICIVSNALFLKAYCPDARIAVSASACAGTTKENHLAALKVMQSCQIDIE